MKPSTHARTAPAPKPTDRDSTAGHGRTPYSDRARASSFGSRAGSPSEGMKSRPICSFGGAGALGRCGLVSDESVACLGETPARRGELGRLDTGIFALMTGPGAA